jgi:hypothetical protein
MSKLPAPATQAGEEAGVTREGKEGEEAMSGIEVWTLVWICLDMMVPDCAAMHNRPETFGSKPWPYYKDEQCVWSAEHRAELLYNEKGFKLEYRCDHTDGRAWRVFVPTRRYK